MTETKNKITFDKNKDKFLVYYITEREIKAKIKNISYVELAYIKDLLKARVRRDMNNQIEKSEAEKLIKKLNASTKNKKKKSK